MQSHMGGSTVISGVCKAHMRGLYPTFQGGVFADEPTIEQQLGPFVMSNVYMLLDRFLV